MALASFAYHWVGGDFFALEQFQSACDSVASGLEDASRALSSQVSASSDGWTGLAGDTFRGTWDTDASAASAVADAWREMGTIIGTLGQRLAGLESQLEKAADAAEKQGVSIDPADGSVRPAAPADACLSPKAEAAAKKTALAAAEYTVIRSEILNQAKQDRALAATPLAKLAEDLKAPGLDPGTVLTAVDTVRGMEGTPADMNEDAIDDFLKTDGSTSPEELSQIWARLENAPVPSTAAKFAAGDAEALNLSGVGGAAVKSIPFLAAAGGFGITVAQDRALHESWRESVIDGVATNGTATAAGLGVTGLLGGGSVVATGGAVLVGGVLAVGVGDTVHNIVQENWGADWQQHGAVGGTLDGIGHVASKTGDDLYNTGKSVVNFIGGL